MANLLIGSDTRAVGWKEPEGVRRSIIVAPSRGPVESSALSSRGMFGQHVSGKEAGSVGYAPTTFSMTEYRRWNGDKLSNEKISWVLDDRGSSEIRANVRAIPPSIGRRCNRFARPLIWTGGFDVTILKLDPSGGRKPSEAANDPVHTFLGGLTPPRSGRNYPFAFSFANRSAKSAGGSASQLTKSSVSGCWKPRWAACSMGRFAPVSSGYGIPPLGRS